MLEMFESASMTKKRTEPLCAAGVYLRRTTSISSFVTVACCSFALISVAFAFVASRVAMSSVLSRMLPVAFESSRSSVSSSCLSSAAESLISFTSSSRCASRSGLSCFTVTFKSWSRSPSCVTL